MREDFMTWSRKRSTVANEQAEASVWLTSISIISNQSTIRSATTPVTPSSASAAMAKIEEALRTELSGGHWPVTLTIGVATFRLPPDTVEAAVQQADDLMYEGKQMGKNTRNHRVIAGSCGGLQP